MKVLVLEDNQNLAEIINDVLLEQGYKVELYRDGLEVLENLANGYDCFILDINVPNIDGLTILKDIRDFGLDTPVIIISSHIELDTIKQAYKKGCNDFLKKPFYIDELMIKIDLLCQKNNTFLLQGGYYFLKKEETLFDDLNNEVSLTKKEKLLLNLLLKNRNQSISLENIQEYVWQGEETTIMSVRSLVKRLRQKLPQNTIVTKNYAYKINFQ